jgi:hypothetical protein
LPPPDSICPRWYAGVSHRTATELLRAERVLYPMSREVMEISVIVDTPRTSAFKTP